MDKKQFIEEYLVDRKGTNCMKWDGLEAKFGDADLIGMWVADTEFKTSKKIRNALAERVEHGVFGYTDAPEEYYTVFSNWMESNYGYPIKKEWVRFTTGCVTALAYAINCYTEPGDTCMILTPVYYPFFNVVTNNKRKLAEAELIYDGEGCWFMDYEAIERKIADQNVKLLLLCSPHNPCGRVWSEEELDKLLEICKKYNVLVASDEIHQDFVLNPHKKFVPAASVAGGKYSDMIITINSASKTFNMATLLHGHIIISDDKLRAKYDQYASGINRTEISVLGMIGTMVGYQDGKEWLDNMKEVVRDNYNMLKNELAVRLPKIKVCCLDATYLVMIDLRGYVSKKDVHDFVQKKCGLGVDYGEWFGEKYEGFIRMNLATDPEYVRIAVDRICAAVENN
ncbi:MAG: MalY/PatB family protein [Lachnospiraceae bacterium]